MPEPNSIVVENRASDSIQGDVLALLSAHANRKCAVCVSAHRLMPTLGLFTRVFGKARHQLMFEFKREEPNGTVYLFSEGSALSGHRFDVVIYVKDPDRYSSSLEHEQKREFAGHLRMKIGPGGVFWECYQQ